MKITQAWVFDPTINNKIDFPELCVQVDMLPDVSIADAHFGGGWTVGKYGPFVKYSCSSSEPIDAGDFNVRFRGRFPVVVDITLVYGSSEEVTKDYSLPLSRARQLVRKFEPSWRLLINDHAAERGSLLWLPYESDPSCRDWTEGKICGNRPTRPIRVQEVDLALCERHVQAHNARHAQKRTAKAS